MVVTKHIKNKMASPGSQTDIVDRIMGRRHFNNFEKDVHKAIGDALEIEGDIKEHKIKKAFDKLGDEHEKVKAGNKALDKFVDDFISGIDEEVKILIKEVKILEEGIAREDLPGEETRKKEALIKEDINRLKVILKELRINTFAEEGVLA